MTAMADDLDTRFDDVARRLRAELIEIAVDQISRPIAHEFDIRIALDRSAGRAQVVLVEASSRSVQPVVTRITVIVRPEPDGTHLVIERDGGSHRLEVDLADADPVISDELHHRLSDFVAAVIASALARLNAEMQRLLGQHGGWVGPNDAEDGEE
jgi:hypothetical protein